MREIYGDLYRDWLRWSRAERLTAWLLLGLSLAGGAAVVLGGLS